MANNIDCIIVIIIAIRSCEIRGGCCNNTGKAEAYSFYLVTCFTIRLFVFMPIRVSRWSERSTFELAAKYR